MSLRHQESVGSKIKTCQHMEYSYLDMYRFGFDSHEIQASDVNG